MVESQIEDIFSRMNTNTPKRQPDAMKPKGNVNIVRSILPSFTSSMEIPGKENKHDIAIFIIYLRVICRVFVLQALFQKIVTLLATYFQNQGYPFRIYAQLKQYSHMWARSKASARGEGSDFEIERGSQMKMPKIGFYCIFISLGPIFAYGGIHPLTPMCL